MDVKGVFGQILAIGAGSAMILRAFGKDEAATAVQNCTQHIGPDTLPACKDAVQQVAAAGQGMIDGILSVVTLIGAQLNLFSHPPKTGPTQVVVVADTSKTLGSEPSADNSSKDSSNGGRSS